MWLDDKLPETHMAPVVPETGEVWEEKLWELAELATDWRYEADDELRKDALARYHAAKEGVTFAEKPYFRGHTLMLGAAFAGVKIPEMVSCHPATWERLPQSVKDKYDVRIHKDYDWSNGDHQGHPTTKESA
ncbi:MAG: hypothetical protein IAE97_13150 [Chthoniobacterales bacterium]|nr:hypothetical protein [Chthoniobacterales bacterium]